MLVYVFFKAFDTIFIVVTSEQKISTQSLLLRPVRFLCGHVDMRCGRHPVARQYNLHVGVGR